MLRQLPDQSFAGPGLRAAVYMFRQPFVLVPGLVASVAWGWLLVAMPGKSGDATPGTIAMMVAISLVCGFGVAVLTGLPAFLAYRFFTNPKPRLELRENETAIEELRANHFLGDEGRGGKLYVTSTRLAFLPHRLNVQLDGVEIALDEVVSVGWRRIVRARNTLATTLEIETAERTEVFVVKNAQGAAERISALVE